MINKDEQYYIYFLSAKKRVTIAKRAVINCRRCIDSFCKKQHYHGIFVCFREKHMKCDKRCMPCSLQCSENILFLNHTTTEEGGDKHSWFECLAENKSPCDRIKLSLLKMNSIYKIFELNSIKEQCATIKKKRKRQQCFCKALAILLLIICTIMTTYVASKFEGWYAKNQLLCTIIGWNLTVLFSVLGLTYRLDLLLNRFLTKIKLQKDYSKEIASLQEKEKELIEEINNNEEVRV